MSTFIFVLAGLFSNDFGVASDTNLVILAPIALALAVSAQLAKYRKVHSQTTVTRQLAIIAYSASTG